MPSISSHEPCDNGAMTRRLMAAAALAAAVSAGCHGISSPSSNASVDFTGTILPVTSANYMPNSYQFSAGKTGEITMKLTAVAPDATVILGIGYGQMSGGTCVPFQGYTTLTRLNGPTPFGGPISVQKGSYCIIVYDAGGLVQAETYTVNVTYP
jgi:hypothetical protein